MAKTLPKVRLQKSPNVFFKVDQIDSRILKIRNELIGQGYDCFLVGGCIRDLMSEKKPKDFDLVTNARPTNILHIFKKKARLVGHRFPIVHVRKAGIVAEVATFRSSNSLNIDYGKSGLIVRDESFGVIEEDVSRRDFTVNALYYDPDRNEILDFLNGIDDLYSQKLKFIGNPEIRIREDPIRLLRYLRFVAKLNFKLDQSMMLLINTHAKLLSQVSSARLLGEFTKMFLQGNAYKVWRLLISTNIPGLIWPDCEIRDPIISYGLKQTDKRFKNKQPLSPAFVIALLLWSNFEVKTGKINPDQSRIIGKKILSYQNLKMKIPVRYREFILNIWTIQSKLTNEKVRRNTNLAKHRDFRAGYDLLLIRSQADPSLKNSLHFWSKHRKSFSK